MKKIVQNFVDWLDVPYRFTARYNLNGFRRIYHIHIRKTGGTSLNHMFLDLARKTDKAVDVYKELSKTKNHRATRDGKIYVGWNQKLINRGHYFYAFSHAPLHELNLPPDTFTVTVLRDPVKRVLSHYKMLVEYRDNKIEHPAMKRDGAWLGQSMDDFLDRIPKEHLLRQLYMFSSTFDIEDAYQGIKKCSHVIFTENFDTGISSLNSKLGIQLKPIHMRQSKSAPLISDEQVSRLRDMLKQEYDLIKRVQADITVSH